MFAVVEGDLLRETNDFARASSAQQQIRLKDAEDLTVRLWGWGGRTSRRDA